jgi:hypothetical protein
MGRNDRRPPAPPSDPTKEGTGVTSFGLGFRLPTPGKPQSPPSGVRSMGGPTPPQPSLVFVTPRSRADSEPEGEAGLTAIGAPPESLLALSRERETMASEARRASSRFWGILWFVVGLTVGSAGVWAAKGDVTKDVYRARVWMGGVVWSVRARVMGETPPPPRAPAPQRGSGAR